MTPQKGLMSSKIFYEKLKGKKLFNGNVLFVVSFTLNERSLFTFSQAFSFNERFKEMYKIADLK